MADRRDVTIRPPAAHSAARGQLAQPASSVVSPEPDIATAIASGDITDRELVQILAATIRRLEAEKRTQQLAVGTISTVATALVKAVMEGAQVETLNGEPGIRIYRPTIDAVTGAELTVEEDGDRHVVVRLRERAPHAQPFHVEED